MFSTNGASLTWLQLFEGWLQQQKLTLPNFRLRTLIGFLSRLGLVLCTIFATRKASFNGCVGASKCSHGYLSHSSLDNKQPWSFWNIFYLNFYVFLKIILILNSCLKFHVIFIKNRPVYLFKNISPRQILVIFPNSITWVALLYALLCV